MSKFIIVPLEKAWRDLFSPLRKTWSDEARAAAMAARQAAHEAKADGLNTRQAAVIAKALVMKGRSPVDAVKETIAHMKGQPIKTATTPPTDEEYHAVSVNGGDMVGDYTVDTYGAMPEGNGEADPDGFDMAKNFKPQEGDKYISVHLYDEGKAEGGTSLFAANNGQVRYAGGQGSGPWGIPPGPEALMGPNAKDIMPERDFHNALKDEAASWKKRWEPYMEKK